MDEKNPLGNEGETQLEQSHQKSPEEVQYEHEKNMFSTHIATSGEQVPDNFENADAWFDSLKNAQKQYTQGQQELASMREQAEQAVPEPEQTAPAVTQEEFSDKMLRLEAPQEQPKEEVTFGVDESTYDKWGLEFAAKGTLSDETRTEIKQKTGFTDRMVNDFIDAQTARLRESYRKAANVVGGQDNLNSSFDWAAQNLTPQQMDEVNMGLSSPSYEITLRGLEGMYNARPQQKVKEQEPAQSGNLRNVAASETGIKPYSTQREFKQERNDPKFKLEPSYREMVQNRMSLTDWNTLPV